MNIPAHMIPVPTSPVLYPVRNEFTKALPALSSVPPVIGASGLNMAQIMITISVTRRIGVRYFPILSITLDLFIAK